MKSKTVAGYDDHFYPKLWLITGVAIIAASAVLWIWLQLASRVTKENSFAPADSVEQQVMPDHFPMDLGNLADIVPVLDLTKVADKQDSAHAPEFKASAFTSQHASDWTLQVMNVSQETVITDFLAKRSDRGRFQYFRYHKGGKDESFILTYGVFGTVATAMGAMQTMDFGLPPAVKAFPERFSSYQPFVSDSDNNVVDASANNLHQVKLRPVALPAPTDAIESKISQLADGGTVEEQPTLIDHSSRGRAGALPAGVDGFSGVPDAPPPSADTPDSGKGRPVAPTSVAPVQDPFNQ
jgi:hypothetical protein